MQVLVDAADRLSKATEPALNATVEKAGQLGAAIAGAIPLVGGMVGSVVQSLTANRGGMDSNFVLPSTPHGESVMAAAVGQSQQQGLGLAGFSDKVKDQVASVKLFAAVEASPAELGRMTAPAIFNGKVREADGHGISQA